MEVWFWVGGIVLTFYIIGTIHDYIQEKKNLKERTIADLAAEKRLRAENKQHDLINKQKQLYRDTALIEKLINIADKSIQSSTKIKSSNPKQRLSMKSTKT